METIITLFSAMVLAGSVICLSLAALYFAVRRWKSGARR